MDDIYIRRIMWLGLSATFLGAISHITFLDLDLFHQLALFREIMKTGSFPQTDIFSYTSTIAPVIHHEWGAGAIHYLLIINQGLGGNGLLLFKYLLTMIVCLGIYMFAKRQGASDYAFSFIAFWGISLGYIGFTTIRAQLFSLLFLVIFLFLIEEDRKGKTWALLTWLPIYLFWLNIHGGFLIGLGLFGIYIIELFLAVLIHEKNLSKALGYIRYRLIILIIMCFLTLLNPFGIAYITTIFHAITLDRTIFIREWQPIWQVNSTNFSLFILSIIVVLYAWYRKNKFLQLPGAILLLTTAWLALWHYRHLSIYAVVLVCYTSVFLENTELSNLLKKYKKWLCILLIISGLVGIYKASSNKFWQLYIPTVPNPDENGETILVYPVGAVDYLKEKKFSGNMMTHFNAGSYTSWHLFPQVKVSMDSRFEAAYTVSQVAENFDFYDAKDGWQHTLARYRTDAILVPRWKPIERALSEDSQVSSVNWKKVYIDDAYSIYLRADLAKQYPFVDRRGEEILGTFP